MLIVQRIEAPFNQMVGDGVVFLVLVKAEKRRNYYGQNGGILVAPEANSLVCTVGRHFEDLHSREANSPVCTVGRHVEDLHLRDCHLQMYMFRLKDGMMGDLEDNGIMATMKWRLK